MFIFHNNGNDKLYLGSADLMERNLRRRIEVVFPLYNEKLKAQIKKIIDLQLKDNTKATLINTFCENVKITPRSNAKIRRAQIDTFHYLRKTRY